MKTAFKPEYEAPARAAGRPDPRPFAERRAEVERRLLDAMLTLKAVDRPIGQGVGNSWPDYVNDFGDQVGWETPKTPPRQKFKPTAAQVDDLLPALGLLQGLRTEYFHVVYLKAWGDFIGRITWKEIGAEFHRGETWARDAYERAVMQACRVAGVLPKASMDTAVVIVSVMLDAVFITWVGTSKNPRQTLYDLKAKNALPIVDASAIWVAGPPLAKRVVEAARALYRERSRHGAWFLINPFDMEDTVLSQLALLTPSWRIEHMEGALSPSPDKAETWR